MLAILCARYRDFPPIVASILQVLFYLTPIIWMPASFYSTESSYLLDFNPVHHFFEIVREPILGELPSMFSCYISSIISIVGWLLSLLILGAYKKIIIYWI